VNKAIKKKVFVTLTATHTKKPFPNCAGNAFDGENRK
jgi:hypothetical protein